MTTKKLGQRFCWCWCWRCCLELPEFILSQNDVIMVRQYRQYIVDVIVYRITSLFVYSNMTKRPNRNSLHEFVHITAWSKSVDQFISNWNCHKAPNSHLKKVNPYYPVTLIISTIIYDPSLKSIMSHK